jgi:protein-S-isoprenylcysteine O-methyltransferase Ste14
MFYWWSAFALLLGCRVWLCCGMLSSTRIEAIGLALIEGASIVLGSVNAVAAKRRDYRPVGLVVPAAYAAGIWLLPQSGETLLAERWIVFVAAVSLSTCAMTCLGLRFSLGPTAWLSLCDWGPYRWMRHPQLAARLLIVVAVAMSGPDTLALCRLVGCVALTLAVIDVEESMLRNVGAWSDYAARVKWRLLPGVW